MNDFLLQGKISCFDEITFQNQPFHSKITKKKFNYFLIKY